MAARTPADEFADQHTPGLLTLIRQLQILLRFVGTRQNRELYACTFIYQLENFLYELLS